MLMRQIYATNFDAVNELSGIVRLKGYTDFKGAIRLIQNGCNPNTSDSQDNTLLHLAAARDPSYIPALLKLKVNPNILTTEKKSAFQVLMEHPRHTLSEKVYYGLALLQHGAVISLEEKKQFLTAIKTVYPQADAYFKRHGIPDTELNDPVFIFSSLNIAELRLAIKDLYRSRSVILNLLLDLAAEKVKIKNEQGFQGSILQRLPFDILYLMLAEYVATDQRISTVEIQALNAFITANYAAIKEFVKTPGGINIAYSINKEKQYQFRLFKAVPKPQCQAYHDFRLEVKRTQVHKNPTFDSVIGKVFTNTSLQRLAEKRQQCGAELLPEMQLQKGKVLTVNQLTDIELFEDTDLAKDNNKQKKKL